MESSGRRLTKPPKRFEDMYGDAILSAIGIEEEKSTSVPSSSKKVIKKVSKPQRGRKQSCKAGVLKPACHNFARKAVKKSLQQLQKKPETQIISFKRTPKAPERFVEEQEWDSLKAKLKSSWKSKVTSKSPFGKKSSAQPGLALQVPKKQNESQKVSVSSLVSSGRTFFHSKTLLPVLGADDPDSEDEKDHSVVPKLMERSISCKKGLSEKDKNFMNLWNAFMQENSTNYVGISHIREACREFLSKHGAEMKRSDLESSWAAHLYTLRESELLTDFESMALQLSLLNWQ